jgi:uncharacterized protein YlaN (UPF0358 family)
MFLLANDAKKIVHLISIDLDHIYTNITCIRGQVNLSELKQNEFLTPVFPDQFQT